MKKLITLILTLSLCLSLAACSGGTTSQGESSQSPAASTPAASSSQGASSTPADAESDLAYVQDQGTLYVGITNFAPMDYKEAGSDEWIGFDADMAKAFAESLGVEVEFIEIDWDNKILELNSKSIDAVWNGMTLTNEVLNSMECTMPYCNNAQVVVVKADVADQYQDAESLTDLAFAVEAGSAGEAAVDELGLEYTAVATQADALMNVAAGTADACVIDLLMAGAMIGEGTSYEQLSYTVSLTEEKYGVGFRTGSDLAEAFNSFYKDAFAAGTVEEIATVYGVQESIVAE